MSLHIPTASRISHSTQTKTNGHPRRPHLSLVSILSNLHLLLRVPSFARWPLRLHFFAPEAHSAWEKWCKTANEPMREGLQVVTDFGPPQTDTDTVTEARKSPAKSGAWGIHALPLDYAPVRDYVAKGQSIFSFEREGRCVVCSEHQNPGNGLYAVCTNEGCEGVGHLSCWSRHLLAEEMGASHEVILPRQGHCPKCGGEVKWEDLMKELTLRVRGHKEVEKLLKKKRAAKTQSAAGTA